MKKEEKKLIEFLQRESSKVVEFRNNVLTCYSEEVGIDDLSRALKVPSNLVVSFFWKSGRNITKNQVLNSDLVKEYCKSKRISVELKKPIEINQIMGEFLSINKGEKIFSRMPIVSVMGHVDHGKSTLLDTIREKQEQKKEEGGITQKINIYPVELTGKKITFLDTPGHKVFLKMRERGASFTDLIILVIAADDGVMQQTLEVIEYIHKYKIPTIVFINNKKKELVSNKELDRIKAQLQSKKLIPTDWGGETTIISGSATSKTDTDNLLETILLLSEIHDWKSELDCQPNGIVLDSYSSDKTGIVSVILLKNGLLKSRDILFVNGESGRIKRIINFSGKELTKVEPGDIVKVFGLGFEVEPGDNFLVINDEKLIKKIKKTVSIKSGQKNSLQVDNSLGNSDSKSTKKNINLILITDSQSSLEALENIVRKNSTENVFFNPVYTEAGDLNDSVINLSKITQSFILLFNIKLSQQKIKNLKDNEINWFTSPIIYKIEDNLAELVRSFRERKKVERIIGIAEIKKIFYFSQVGSIAGCQVLNGSINRNHLVNVFRKEEKIFSGKIGSLQKDKNNIREINKGQECGIVITNFNDFQINDRIISYSLADEEKNV